MSFTFDTGTNIGKVRALIKDTNASDFLLSDEEINVYLGITSNEVLSASAMALRAIVANKALVEKLVASGDYKEDNRGTVKVLLALADSYEKQANSMPAEAYLEQNLNDFSYIDNLYRRILRGEE